MSTKESYQFDAPQPQYRKENRLQQSYSPCEDCPGIQEARAIRTQYDQFWLQYYNQKAKEAPTNLIHLKFEK